MPRPLDFLGLFQPNGCTTEASDQHALTPWTCLNDDEQAAAGGGLAYSYFLFPQVLARQKGTALEHRATLEGDWNHDEEIFIHDNLVVWSAGGHVRKRFSSQFKVMQALWCQFDSMQESILCMLHSDSLTTCTPSGTMNSIPLEFSAMSMWTLPCGLLIEREKKHHTPFGEGGAAKHTPYSGAVDLYRDSFRDGATPSPGGKTSTGGYGLWPGSVKKAATHASVPAPPPSMLYVLLHPLDEIQAVQIEDAGKLHSASNFEDRVIWSSSHLSYVACYHPSKMQHSAWQVKVVSSRLGTEALGPPSTQSQRVVLRCVWQEKGQQAKATEVFSAADADGVPLLCLVLREQRRLAALRLPHELHQNANISSPKLEISWTIPAVSAAPVSVTRTGSGLRQAILMDILALAPDGNLWLYVGNSCICQYHLPLSVLSDPTQDSLGAEEVKWLSLEGSRCLDAPPMQGSRAQVPVTSLCDAVYNRVNARSLSGKKYRCAVTLLPSSAISSSCLLALSEALRPDIYHQLLSGLLEGQLSGSQADSMSAGPDGLPDTAWSTFSDFILDWAKKLLKCSYRGPTPTEDPEEPSPWSFLLRSKWHQMNVISMRYPALPMPQVPLSVPEAARILEDTSKKPTVVPSVYLEVLEALHAVYEDQKLDSLRWKNLLPLAKLLCKLAMLIGEAEYVDYYTRDFPTAISDVSGASTSHFRGINRTPCSLLRWLENRVKGKYPASNEESLPSLLFKDGVMCVDWSRKVLGFYDLMIGGQRSGDFSETGFHMRLSKGSVNTSEQRTVLAMVAEGFGLPNLDRLPSGVSIPLRHALERCREAPPDDWPVNAYVLVGREDLAATRLARRASMHQNPGSASHPLTSGSPEEDDVLMAAPYMLHLQPVTLERSTNDAQEANHLEAQVSAAIDSQLNDGMEHVFTASGLRFGSDLRLNEVRRLLCSSRPVAISTANSPDLSDPDLVAQQQAQLWQLAQRTTALPFGRGAFTLATLRPLLTEALPIPKLVLAGRLPSQHDATVNLDGNSGNVQDLTLWPEFHNGVAAGLRLAPCQAKITRTWILYNKPDEFNHAHAGVLMALGLHRHLGVLAATDVYRYLAEEHEATTVGLLLGMASAHRGTMDPAISKMLYLHIPARHPPSFPELELPTLMQSAALMAVGLLYQGSAHRLTTEILLAEIGRKPGSDLGLEREGYALAAGLALGLVTLGRGIDAWGLADLCIEDRLKHLMFGGVEPYDERRRKFDGSITSNSFPPAPRSIDDSHGQVMEGSMTNLDVTAPGATLALGLMFLKTNSEEVAARLSIPDTHFALEYVRPDFILLRVVARSLILWDSVQASEDWVQSQIPAIVKDFLNSDKQGGVQGSLADADFEALAQAHVNIIAGTCLSIGLRYAGTASAEAQQLLHAYALYFMKEKRAAAPLGGTSSPDGRRTYVDRNTLETCLNVVILSLSVVMAGTGHLGTFRLLRYLRRRNDTDAATSFGNHMAISMAIGFLFLGGGSITFATNNGAVAALLIALYPRFPTSPNDHRCHLQAFRHLYVLATEARCVQTVDVDSGLPVFVPIELTLKESNSYRETIISKITPCLLPERSSLKRVRICGPRYWPQDIELPATADQPWWFPGEVGGPFNEGVLYVKRKVGARSYIDDPIGCRSLLSRALHKDGGGSGFESSSGTGDGPALSTSKVDQLISTFSADPSMLAFAQLLCRTSYQKEGADDFEDFCLQSLFECVSTDRPGLLQTYMALYTTVEAIVNRLTGRGSSPMCNGNDTVSLYSLKVALAYAESVGQAGISPFKGESIIQLTFLAALAKRVDEALSLVHSKVGDDAGRSEAMDLARYIKSREWPGDAPTAIESWESRKQVVVRRIMFSCYLCWYDVPQPGIVQAAIHQVSRFPEEFRRSLMESNAVLPVLASFMAGTPSPALLRIHRCLPFLQN